VGIAIVASKMETSPPKTLVHLAIAGSPMGDLVIGATDRGICLLQFRNDDESLETAVNGRRGWGSMPEPPVLLGCWLDGIRSTMTGSTATPDVPVDATGTPFQRAVWDFLQTIPRGSTASYQAVALGIARPNAVRAVASACANNPVAILIPCHRVIRGNGDLAGYRWGLDRKRALLAMERCGGVL